VILLSGYVAVLLTFFLLVLYFNTSALAGGIPMGTTKNPRRWRDEMAFVDRGSLVEARVYSLRCILRQSITCCWSLRSISAHVIPATHGSKVNRRSMQYTKDTMLYYSSTCWPLRGCAPVNSSRSRPTAPCLNQVGIFRPQRQPSQRTKHNLE